MPIIVETEIDSTAFASMWVPDLLALAARYVTKLRLEEWNVTIQYVRHWRMPSAGTVAQVETDWIAKSASITVLHPVDLTDCCSDSIEESVAHEMVHTFLTPLETYLPEKGPEGKRAGDLIEQLTITLGKALLPERMEDRLDQPPTTPARRRNR